MIFASFSSPSPPVTLPSVSASDSSAFSSFPPLHVSLISPCQTVQPSPLRAPLVPQHLPACRISSQGRQFCSTTLTVLWAQRYAGVKAGRTLNSPHSLMFQSRSSRGQQHANRKHQPELSAGGADVRAQTALQAAIRAEAVLRTDPVLHPGTAKRCHGAKKATMEQRKISISRMRPPKAICKQESGSQEYHVFVSQPAGWQ